MMSTSQTPQSATQMMSTSQTPQSATQMMSCNPCQLRKIEDYIDANLGKKIDTTVLSEITGSNVHTVSRNFQKEYGFSPFTFVKAVRLDKARLMLSNPHTVSVIAVALRCGFQSVGHFAKLYRARFGELPSETLHGSARRPNDIPAEPVPAV